MRVMQQAGAAALAMLILPATDAGAGQRHRWWQSEDVKTELRLSEDQSTALEEIYQTTLPELRELKQRLDRKEAQLSQLIDAMEAEEWEITLQIDKVEAIRGELSKARILMLYRMHRELSAEQRDALHEWWDRPRSERRSRPER